MSEALPQSPFAEAVWFYQAPDVSVSAERGLRRALSRDWQSGTLQERTADLRGWLASNAWARARLVGFVGQVGEVLAVDPVHRSAAPVDAERSAAARLLGVSVRDLAASDPAGFAGFVLPGQLVTRTFPEETQGLPALAIVAIALAGAAATAYVAHQAAQLIDNYLAREDRAARLLETDAQAIRVIEKHTAREDQAGKPLPLDAASIAELDRLRGRQEELLRQIPPPVSSGVPEVGLSAGFGFGAALCAAVVAVGWYLQRG